MPVIKIKNILFCIVFLVLIQNVSGQTNISTDSINKEFIKSEIKNQQAQAEYYKRQATPATTFLGGLLPIIGTLLGAIIAFISLNSQNKRNFTNEEIRRKKQQDFEFEQTRILKEEENYKNATIAAAELMRKIAVAAHNLTWVLWIAKNNPNSFNNELIHTYDEKMESIHAEIVSAQIVLSSYDKMLFDETKKIVYSIHEYDGKISKLAIKYTGNDLDAIDQLGYLWKEVYSFSNNIPEKFALILDVSINRKILKE